MAIWSAVLDIQPLRCPRRPREATGHAPWRIEHLYPSLSIYIPFEKPRTMVSGWCKKHEYFWWWKGFSTVPHIVKHCRFIMNCRSCRVRFLKARKPDIQNWPAPGRNRVEKDGQRWRPVAAIRRFTWAQDGQSQVLSPDSAILCIFWYYETCISWCFWNSQSFLQISKWRANYFRIFFFDQV